MQLLHEVKQMVIIAIKEPLASCVGHMGGAAFAIESKVHDLAQDAAQSARKQSSCLKRIAGLEGITGCGDRYSDRDIRYS